MAITRRLVAHDENESNVWLKVDHSSRFIQNESDEWQFLFGPESSLSGSEYILKVSARFDDNTFDNIKFVAYLYDTKNASIGSLASCEFKIYKVVLPDWSETLEYTFSGSELSNSYYYVNPSLASMSNIDFSGGDTIMVEATVIRSGTTYRDRIYFNHLGIYDSLLRVKRDVDFLFVTKKDE